MTTQQETKTEKYLFWGVTVLLSLSMAFGSYIYTNNLKVQASIDARQDAQIVKLQEQMLEVLKYNSSTEQILKSLSERVNSNTELIKDGFDNLEEKLDKIK